MGKTRDAWFVAPTLDRLAEKATRWTTCSGCDNKWTGLSTCHCAGCHRTFTGITAFDHHRVGGKCVDPAERGLVPAVRRHWTGWGWPGDDTRFDTDD